MVAEACPRLLRLLKVSITVIDIKSLKDRGTAKRKQKKKKRSSSAEWGPKYICYNLKVSSN